MKFIDIKRLAIPLGITVNSGTHLDDILDSITQLREENAKLQAVVVAAKKVQANFSEHQGARLTSRDVIVLMRLNEALAALASVEVMDKTKLVTLTESEADPRGAKIRITLWVDAETVLAYKQKAQETGAKYQSLMNEALRNAVDLHPMDTKESK